jgi:hypothetical protein
MHVAEAQSFLAVFKCCLEFAVLDLHTQGAVIAGGY